MSDYDRGYADGRADEYHAIMDILNRCGVTVCMEDKQLLTIAEYVEKRYEELGFRKPQQKTGEWIEDYQEDASPFSKKGWKCSNCNSRTSYGTPPFCMRCGAKMEVKHE